MNVMSEIRNRYANAAKNPDYTIDQDWSSYSADEDDRWNRLSARVAEILPGRADPAFINAVDRLGLASGGVPDMEKLSKKLRALTGWSVVPVSDLVPDEVFFDHLANRRFPAGAFIRSEAEMDYLEEPDIFHDVFGHVPLLADPIYADFMQAYGAGGQAAMARGQLHNLARLYWYTIEFGLIESADGLRIFGAGILSSTGEIRFALEDDSPNRIGFDLERVMRTDYRIDDFQQTYFVIESFDALLASCHRDFTPVYEAIKGQPDHAPDALVESDRVFHRGTQAYFAGKKQAI
ncbi:phenylalanine 4-monooxygenase [Pontivivens insulae]|uniref:Phenylalanine-4-hydroxylase n=1 Tax=Pontivivens insulae TaxID=1639689 RepID=A0A2R8AFU1_9RHOB|nr:phenylalanine 4-monooxygenase [Pontivivens insulae]RED12300.1 phenylalanine 4-hydroxylase [Pontivivens insulae]SPF31057.1 Phenylalanine-4-hydroxylase [Pontivivens insulae]